MSWNRFPKAVLVAAIVVLTCLGLAASSAALAGPVHALTPGVASPTPVPVATATPRGSLDPQLVDLARRDPFGSVLGKSGFKDLRDIKLVRAPKARPVSGGTVAAWMLGTPALLGGAALLLVARRRRTRAAP